MSITDGYSPANTEAGGGGAKAFAPADSSTSRYQHSSDGDNAFNETAESESAYVGAKFETSRDDFVRAGSSITDGTTK